MLAEHSKVWELRISYLQESGIPVPNHICVNRDNLPEGQDPEGFIETEDYVEVNGEPLTVA